MFSPEIGHLENFDRSFGRNIVGIRSVPSESPSEIGVRILGKSNNIIGGEVKMIDNGSSVFKSEGNGDVICSIEQKLSIIID